MLTALDDEDLERRISGDQAACNDTRRRSTWIKTSQSLDMHVTRATNNLPPAKMISNSRDIAKKESGRERCRNHNWHWR